VLFLLCVHMKVSKRSYDTCSLSSDVETILNCSTPRQLRRFTMFFEPFQAIPNAPEFHAGHSYYFISKFVSPILWDANCWFG